MDESVISDEQVEFDESGEFSIEGQVDPSAAMGSLEQDLIEDENTSESKEE
jgi:hypothetical protein